MDYSGHIIGDIRIIKRAEGDLEKCRKSLKEKGRSTNPQYSCECLACGKIFVRDIYAIKNNKFKNCGCQNLQYDLTNTRYGKLIAIKPLGLNNHKEMMWHCLCDCGNEHIATSYSLRTQKATQCKECSNLQIGEKNRKYQIHSKRLYECYRNMKTRCTNKKQDSKKRYINRGISMCPEWESDYCAFQTWALENGYREDLTIDRIDNNGNYEPSNCRFVSRNEQANNRRTNIYLTYNGTTDTMANWCKNLNLPYYYVQYRVNKGKNLEDILNEFNNGTRRTRKKIASR